MQWLSGHGAGAREAVADLGHEPLGPFAQRLPCRLEQRLYLLVGDSLANVVLGLESERRLWGSGAELQDAAR